MEDIEEVAQWFPMGVGKGAGKVVEGENDISERKKALQERMARLKVLRGSKRWHLVFRRKENLECLR